MTFGSLFAGIGGLDLGLERAGMVCKWQVEIDPYCQRVLAKHWPDVRRWDDVTTFPPEGDWGVDLICGGFPCQDISYAGLGAGMEGDRSGLWRDFSRTIRILRPRFIIVENVPALLGRGLDRVLWDLAEGGYDAEWESLSACMFGAPHMRHRVFVVAYPQVDLVQERVWGKYQYDRSVCSTSVSADRNAWLASIADLDGRTTRTSDTVDRLRGLGNAVVPQVAEWIGKQIMEIEAVK